MSDRTTNQFRYDAIARITSSTQTTDGVGYPFTYAYYMDGSVASVQYPSGRTVSYPSVDRAGRLTEVTGTLGGVSKSYVSAMTYNEQGLMAATALGNALTERWSYNAQRLQPYDVRLGTAVNERSHLTLQFAYCANNYAGDSCTTNNGNILAQWNYANNHIEHYGYDAVNRLSSATDYVAAPNGWSQSYSYDRYGNRWVSANGTLPMDPRTPTSQSYIDASNNRLTGANYAYDAAGNQTKHGGWTLAYDAENRLVSSQQSGGYATTYAYDGEGRRVKKTTNGVSTWFVYNASGELAAEYLATPPSGAAATHFVTTDHLGSTRLVTDGSGNVVSRHDYLPFGEEIPAGIGGRTTAMKYVSNAALTQRFTGKERDTETGLDYFGARYMSGVLGRFATPDSGIDQHPGDPQSWNLYAYARNNPILLVDPTGEYVCGSSLTKEQCDAFQNGLDQAQGAANAARQKYGADSDPYKKAQRAIDAYGKAGVDNGVTIQVGDTGKFAAITTVAGTTGARTTDNPTGQEIEVKFRASELGSAMGQTHEGSHVADGSAWIASGFAAAFNPTRFQTEMNAYRVSVTIGEGLGYRISMISFGSNRYLLAHTAWTQETKDAAIKSILRREYPNFQLNAFQKNTRGGR